MASRTLRRSAKVCGSLRGSAILRSAASACRSEGSAATRPAVRSSSSICRRLLLCCQDLALPFVEVHQALSHHAAGLLDFRLQPFSLTFQLRRSAASRLPAVVVCLGLRQG